MTSDPGEPSTPQEDAPLRAEPVERLRDDVRLLGELVGQVLRDSCRVYDMPGRYGGEELCLMLPETKVENTMHVAERIRRRVAATPISVQGGPVHVTTSIGVAGIENVPDEDVFNANSLIERADRALYTAKDRGRNRVETWSSMLSLQQRASALVVEH